MGSIPAASKREMLRVILPIACMVLAVGLGETSAAETREAAASMKPGWL